MGFASYIEDIVTRLTEAQLNFGNEIAALRTRLADSDWTDLSGIKTDTITLRRHIGDFLDELENRSKKLFDDAIRRMSDPRMRFVSILNKREGQLEDASKRASEAATRLKQCRETNARLISDKDTLSSECKKLNQQVTSLKNENIKLAQELKDLRAWKATTSGLKR